MAEHDGEGGADNSFFSMVSGVQPQGRREVGQLDSAENGEAELSESGAEDASDGAEMPHEARRVLVYLMRQGAIIAAQKGKLYEALCRHQGVIRRHLAEVYLRLVLDERAGLGFVARFDSDDEANDESDSENDNDSTESFVSLITRRTLSLYDTLLLLVLRRHYQEREAAGEQKITVDIERLESYLTPFLPLTNHASADRRKLNGAVKNMKDRKLLAPLRGSDDRFEITPLIRYVVDAAFLETMLAEYQRLAAEGDIALPASTVKPSNTPAPSASQGDLLGGND
ncbi:DUF4194 domain-containing protein [Halopseudomonas oceani]|uniref:DUF4194 domain-containing protein n=1 Tax=Halopseudomonas oceani TaxID=1708783 RepID=UPI002AA639C6|nr:DUF4194 domain-containing protein [Halopseudomonas oceani]